MIELVPPRVRRSITARVDGLANTAHRRFTRPLDLSTAAPILVVGNQKTGSTAIAALLARLGNLTFSRDVPPAWNQEPALVRGSFPLDVFLQEHRYYFRRDVVKENTLTFCVARLRGLLPSAHFVFTVREPAQNIRSILDRVGLPGRLRKLDQIGSPSQTWRRVLDVRWLGENVDELIASLSLRWVLTAREYLRLSHQVHLIKYEEFCSDKERSIGQLASALGIRRERSIATVMDAQYQPRGAHRGIRAEEFFSREALETIEEICGGTRARLSYG